MKASELSNLTLRFLLNRSQKGDRGMTMIELLVVIFVLSLLSAIALPSVLLFANRARESEARSYVSTINKGQQGYYLQYNDFGNLGDLGLGIPTITNNYTYSSVRNGTGSNITADTTADPGPTNTMKGFAGQVWLGPSGNSVTSFAILCEGTVGSVPTIAGNTCP